MVAIHLGLTPAAVDGMLRDGRLEPLRIGKSKLVTLRSIKAREAKKDEITAVVYDQLKKLAKAGKRVVFYEPIMKSVGMTPKTPADRTRIGYALAEVSKKAWDDHGVLLSVLVHRKTPGVTRPGPGFFDLAEIMGYSWTDEQEFVEQETDKVLKAFRK